MRQQAELIKSVPWDVLIILDACRADYFAEVCTPEAETVRSPAGNTVFWIAALGKWFESQQAWYVTANPVVSREFQKQKLDIATDLIWQKCWGLHTHAEVPSVHPQAVNGWVMVSKGLCFAPRSRLVVHYIQPHAPYIGEFPLALSRPWKDMPWAKLQDQVRGRCFGPKDMEGQGVTWDQVRLAYHANLALVRQAARQLAREVLRAGKKVVITSDHGEMLGEGGRFGHEWEWNNEPILREVPWLELTPDDEDEDEDERTNRKLEALGYA